MTENEAIAFSGFMFVVGLAIGIVTTMLYLS